MGPITLFDKSFLQAISLDEAVWFDRFFMPVVCPVFYVETLGDLGKESSRLAACRTQVSVFVRADNSIATGGFMVIVPEGSMLFERAFPCQMEWRTRLAAASSGRHGGHPLHVPSHPDEAPPTLDLVQATHEGPT